MVLLADFGGALIFERTFGSLFLFILHVIFLVILFVSTGGFVGFLLFESRVFIDFFSLVVVTGRVFGHEIVGFESFESHFGEYIVAGVGIKGDVVFDEKLQEFGFIVFVEF